MAAQRAPRVGAEGVAAVVRDVEPLVAVDGPRVGGLEPRGEVPGGRAGRRPQAEGAVDVDPCAVVVGDRRRRRRGRRTLRCSRCRPGGTRSSARRVPSAGRRGRGRGRRRRSPPGRRWPRARPRPSRTRAGAGTGRSWRAARRWPPPAPAGPPASPRRSTSQPACGEDVVPGGGEGHGVGRLPAGHEARPTRPAGRPSRSFSHAPATSSTTAAPGDVSGLKAGWSQPTARTSAAVAASRAPPDDEAEVPRPGTWRRAPARRRRRARSRRWPRPGSGRRGGAPAVDGGPRGRRRPGTPAARPPGHGASAALAAASTSRSCREVTPRCSSLGDAPARKFGVPGGPPRTGLSVGRHARAGHRGGGRRRGA